MDVGGGDLMSKHVYGKVIGGIKCNGFLIGFGVGHNTFIVHVG